MVNVLFFSFFFFQNSPTTESQLVRSGCIEIGSGCSPTIYNCKLSSHANGENMFSEFSVLPPSIILCYYVLCTDVLGRGCLLITCSIFVAGATVFVHGRGARPTLSHCLISDSENVGIFVTDGAQVEKAR